MDQDEGVVKLARKSRKNVAEERTSVKENVYDTAFYLRISDKDRECSVSNSIENQQELLQEFIRNKSEFVLVSVFIDDGKTGTNFRRSGFEQMMEAIKAGRINCIIVKDLSRLGRNYLEAGNYIENVFAFLNIRLLAVTDHFDTLTATPAQLAWLLPLKNMMNENYARDISQKERSSKKILRKQGDFIGAYGIYGYERSKDDKHQLIIDEEAAVHVREIYNLYEAGLGDAAIAKYLNRNQVASPARYKYEKGILHHEKYVNTCGWYPQRVAAILTSRVYVGDVVQGVQTSMGMRGKKVTVPKDEWEIVSSAHEPVISQEQFNRVQQIRALKRNGNKKTYLPLETGVFAGKFFCGDCQRAVFRKYVKTCKDSYRYICEKQERNGVCSRKFLKETDLLEAVKKTIQIRVAISANARDSSIQDEKREMQLQKWNKEMCSLNQKQERIKCKKAELYMDWKEGIIDGEQYKAMKANCEKEMNNLHTEITNLTKRKQEYIQVDTMENQAKGSEKDFVMSRQIADIFIEKIEVYEDNRIRIRLRYQDEFGKVFADGE